MIGCDSAPDYLISDFHDIMASGEVSILKTFLTIFSFPVERYFINLTAESWWKLFKTVMMMFRSSIT